MTPFWKSPIRSCQTRTITSCNVGILDVNQLHFRFAFGFKQVVVKAPLTQNSVLAPALQKHCNFVLCSLIKTANISISISLSCSFWHRNIFCQLGCLLSPIFLLDRQDRALSGRAAGLVSHIYIYIHSDTLGMGVGADLTLIQDGRPQRKALDLDDLTGK